MQGLDFIKEDKKMWMVAVNQPPLKSLCLCQEHQFVWSLTYLPSSTQVKMLCTKTSYVQLCRPKKIIITPAKYLQFPRIASVKMMVWLFRIQTICLPFKCIIFQQNIKVTHAGHCSSSGMSLHCRATLCALKCCVIYWIIIRGCRVSYLYRRVTCFPACLGFE